VNDVEGNVGSCACRRRYPITRREGESSNEGTSTGIRPLRLRQAIPEVGITVQQPDMEWMRGKAVQAHAFDRAAARASIQPRVRRLGSRFNVAHSPAGTIEQADCSGDAVFSLKATHDQRLFRVMDEVGEEMVRPRSSRRL